jgi:flagellar protein FlaG
MNTINPQITPPSVQRSDTRGGERTDSNLVPPDTKNGKGLPQVEAKVVANTQEVAKEVDAKDPLVDAVAKLNDYIQTLQRDLKFTLDEDSGKSVISVIDRQSSKVIRQIPNEIVLNLAQKLNNEEPLLLFSAQV